MIKAQFWKQEKDLTSQETNSNQTNKLIIVLGNPRSYTTTQVRIWEARKDGTIIMNEPGVYAYNLISAPQQKPELTEKLFEGGIPTFKGVTQKICEERTKKNVFVKDTVFAGKHYLNTDFPGIDSENTYFFFMLREPADSMVSNYKILKMAIDDNLADAWSYKDMLDLYENLRKHNKNTYLIDSEEFLNDPDNSVEHMCQQVGVPHIPESLHWDPLVGTDRLGPYCKFVPQWQDTIAASSGVDKKLGSRALRDANGQPTFEEIAPEHRMSFINFYESQMVYYKQLLTHLHEQVLEESDVVQLKK